MEVFTVLIIAFLVIAALINASSGRDDDRDYRHNRRSRRRYYEDEDWDDDDDDDDYYYRRRRRRRRGGNTWAGALLGFFFAVILIAVVASYGWDEKSAKETKTHTPPVAAKDSTQQAPRTLDPDEIPENGPKNSPPEYERLVKQHLICLGITDIISFKTIKDRYPNRNIEAFRDQYNRYWVCIFAQTSRELDEVVNLLRLREEDLTEHGLGIVYYQASDLCSGGIIRVKGTDIWFCE